MPCVRLDRRSHRRFLPHLPPGSLRCEFGPELVPPLPHAMMSEFPKTESELPCGSPTPLPPPVIPTAFPQRLIPKPPGEVSRVGRGGYTLKEVLEGKHGWNSGLYDQIRVFPTHLIHSSSVILRSFSGKGSLNSGQTFGHVAYSFRSG